MVILATLLFICKGGEGRYFYSLSPPTRQKENSGAIMCVHSSLTLRTQEDSCHQQDASFAEQQTLVLQEGKRQILH